eukprot:Colp12_sorted_trinity150504_noHs@22811
MDVEIHFAEAVKAREVDGPSKRVHIVTPGEVITKESGYMRGHGTYVVGENLVASVAGIVERVNKLICVRPLRTRYNGEVGDVVVGRITDVAQKKWKVDTCAHQDSILMLSSVNLPGGVLRRKSASDELMMRDYYAEGDLICAEVQSIYTDGSLSLHTRNNKYGKPSSAGARRTCIRSPAVST